MQSGTPVVIGEWGGRYEGTSAQWQQTLQRYARERGLSQFFYALNGNSNSVRVSPYICICVLSIPRATRRLACTCAPQRRPPGITKASCAHCCRWAGSTHTTWITDSTPLPCSPRRQPRTLCRCSSGLSADHQRARPLRLHPLRRPPHQRRRHRRSTRHHRHRCHSAPRSAPPWRLTGGSSAHTMPTALAALSARSTPSPPIASSTVRISLHRGCASVRTMPTALAARSVDSLHHRRNCRCRRDRRRRRQHRRHHQHRHHH